MTWVKWTRKDIMILKNLHAEGKSDKEIANYLKRTVDAVSVKRSKIGVTRRKLNRKSPVGGGNDMPYNLLSKIKDTATLKEVNSSLKLLGYKLAIVEAA